MGITQLSVQDRLNLLDLNNEFQTYEGIHVRIGIRAQNAAYLSLEQRQLLSSLGYDLSFKNSPHFVHRESGGRYTAKILLENNIPFIYAIYGQKRYSRFHPIEIEVTPGKKLNEDKPLSKFESIAQSLNPLQSAIVNAPVSNKYDLSYNAREAVQEEEMNILAMNARGIHPDTVIADNNVYKIVEDLHPDERGGMWAPDSTKFIITYPDGHVRRTRALRFIEKASDVRFLPNCTIQQAPRRESLDFYQGDKTDIKYKDYIRNNNVLILPPAKGQKETKKAISWDSELGQEFLDEEASEKLLRKGINPQVMHEKNYGTFKGKIVFNNEKWLAILDANNKGICREIDIALSEEIYKACKNSHVQDVYCVFDCNINGNIYNFQLINKKEQDVIIKNVAENVARYSIRKEWLENMANGTFIPHDIHHAVTLMKTEPNDVIKKSQELLEKFTLTELLEKEQELITYVQRAESTLRVCHKERRVQFIKMFDDDTMPEFDKADLDNAINNIGELWDTKPLYVANDVKKYDYNYAIGTVEIHEPTGKRVLKDAFSNKMFLCEHTNLLPGEKALIKATGIGEMFSTGPEESEKIYSNLRRLGTYPIKENMYEEACTVLQKQDRFTNKTIDLLTSYADTQRASIALEDINKDNKVILYTFYDDYYPKTYFYLAYSKEHALDIYQNEYDEPRRDLELVKSEEASPVDIWRFSDGRPEDLKKELDKSLVSMHKR